jgi:integrase
MLTAKLIERTTTPGRYRDGDVRGLYLQISARGAKSFVLRYERHGKERMMGLGSAAEFTLKQARERALAARRLLADGIDPLATKRADQQAAKLAEQRKLTFRQAASRYFDQNENKWRNAKHRAQFLTSLSAHVFPTIGDMDVAAIETADVLRALEKGDFWRSKTITADRVRTRIEAVIDWAVVRGHRPTGTNPARWKGHLDQVLPPSRKIAPVAHHKAMPYTEVPAFMAELRAQQGSAARALEYLILTASRSGEVLGAQWSEIDFANGVWTVPGQRMKGGREHRQPLSDAAIALLRSLPRETGNGYVFIGGRADSGLTVMALWLLMERMGLRGTATVHGFRSAFSDWAHERTSHSAHTIEISLAHSVGSETERAYRRTDMVAKRRQLLESWAKFLTTKPLAKDADVVVPMRERV